MPGIMGKAFRKRSRGRAWRKQHSSRRIEEQEAASSASENTIANRESSSPAAQEYEYDSFASAQERWSAESSLSSVTEELRVYDGEEEAFYASSSQEVGVAGHHDSMLAMIIYQRPPPPPLQESVELWLHHAHALFCSKEMTSLLSSSRNVACSTGGLAVTVACLPVTMPVYVLTSTTGVVYGVTCMALSRSMGLLLTNSSCSGGESTSSRRRRSPIQELVHNVTQVVPFLLATATRITQEIGSTAVHLVAPVLCLEQQQKQQEHGSDGQTLVTPRSAAPQATTTSCCTCSGESSAEKESFLDRLRIDIIHLPSSSVQQQQKSSKETSSEADNYPQGISPTSTAVTLTMTITSGAEPSDISKHLLRVDDVHVLLETDDDASSSEQQMRILYIDLGNEFSDPNLTSQALTQLARRGFDVISTNVYSQFSHAHRSHSVRVEWKPEGFTARTLRKMGHWSESECHVRLEKEILVWSGKYQGANYYASEYPLFLARGNVNMSPRNLVNLLWDSNRTTEYNRYCLGRSDVLIIGDDILNGGSYGAKIIKSETKVPFTGLSVVMTVLMHARALEDEDGFVIVSRSLDSGMAGYHAGSNARVEKGNKNEIILGVNLFRPVPGRPDMTELTSVSQVSSSLVPHFLAKRIGMMGVEDFFQNVRNLPSNN